MMLCCHLSRNNWGRPDYDNAQNRLHSVARLSQDKSCSVRGWMGSTTQKKEMVLFSSSLMYWTHKRIHRPVILLRHACKCPKTWIFCHRTENCEPDLWVLRWWFKLLTYPQWNLHNVKSCCAKQLPVGVIFIYGNPENNWHAMQRAWCGQQHQWNAHVHSQNRRTRALVCWTCSVNSRIIRCNTLW